MDDQHFEQAEEGLDPADWNVLRDMAHRIVDDALAHIRDVRDRPVWAEMPGEVRQSYAAPLPVGPQPLSEIYGEVQENLLPYPMGNIHPRFWMWYMGSGSFSGALAEFLSAIDGSNLGGGNNAAALMDRQVVDWLKQMMGFPETASGTLVSGGSMANIIGLTAARNAMAGVDVREEGVGAIPQPLRFYGSDQLHSCHQKAVELLGLGNRALRRVPSDRNLRMDMGALRELIAEDRAKGYRPACVIATAGTVNTGAIDDLPAIRALCDDEGLWFHVDGCIGALIAIAPGNRDLVRGLEAADSLALDPHKWLHVPFEAGCALIRDADRHRQTFAVHPEYLEEKPRGIAATEYLHDYNLQTSRGFRALKVWLTLKEHGVEKFGRLIDQNIAQAAYLAARIEEVPHLELMAPVTINIVCFRFTVPGQPEPDLRELNTEIMLQMQEAGIAALSDTTVAGRHCLRVAICNHRTRRADLDLLVEEVLQIGGDLAV
ncbi:MULTISPECIES: pyridoxal phosphate-dependent decarboxylase family protein [Mameliella]|uniref:pyridoxal phosphate-dependent decarboxylase family protein n=1 Tax=Mameliella TaxID=1434019 RepID=UPI000B53200B|nr:MULTISPECIES: aspartate aminotransferase family protein [Mameliella]MCR9275202.1 aspartate aminotransferase family protein [Paracoccaceae bacterium]OWV52344.1 amino acid decarboxylase [Mameliella alba]